MLCQLPPRVPALRVPALPCEVLRATACRLREHCATAVPPWPDPLCLHVHRVSARCAACLVSSTARWGCAGLMPAAVKTQQSCLNHCSPCICYVQEAGAALSMNNLNVMGSLIKVELAASAYRASPQVLSLTARVVVVGLLVHCLHQAWLATLPAPCKPFAAQAAIYLDS